MEAYLLKGGQIRDSQTSEQFISSEFWFHVPLLPKLSHYSEQHCLFAFPKKHSVVCPLVFVMHRPCAAVCFGKHDVGFKSRRFSFCSIRRFLCRKDVPEWFSTVISFVPPITLSQKLISSLVKKNSLHFQWKTCTCLLSFSLYFSPPVSFEKVVLCVSIHGNGPWESTWAAGGPGKCSVEGALSSWDKAILHRAGLNRTLQDVWCPGV